MKGDVKYMDNHRLKHIKSESVFSSEASFYIHLSNIPETFEMHHHSFFELDFIIDGSGISNINTEYHSIEKGDIIFLKPTDYHEYKADEGKPLKIINIAFPIALIYSKVLTFVPMNCIKLHLNDTEFYSCLHMAEVAIQKYSEQIPDADLFIKFCVEWIFLCMTHSTKKSSEREEGKDCDFTLALAFIHSHFTNMNLRRDDVAQVMYMSATYFSKCFHKVIGIPFQEYLLNLRLNYANGLLKTTQMTILEVALSSGFSSDSYFSKMYKKRFGIAPGKARM